MRLCDNHKHLDQDQGCWVCRAQGAEARSEELGKESERRRVDLVILGMQLRQARVNVSFARSLWIEFRAALAEEVSS